MKNVTGLGMLALALAGVGCPGGGGGAGGGGSGSVTANQSTPKDTIRTAYAAVVKEDRPTYESCFNATGDQKKVADTFFDIQVEMHKLKEAGEKSYGKEGWQKLQAASGQGKSMGFMDPSEERIDSMKEDIQGDKATCSPPGQPATKLVKKGSRWLIDTEDVTSGSGPQMAQVMGVMPGAIRKVREKVGKPGETPETLSQALTTEMMTAMMGAMGGPGGPGAPSLPPELLKRLKKDGGAPAFPGAPAEAPPPPPDGK